MRKVRELEWFGVSNQEKRVLRYNLTKADHGTLIVPIVCGHHAHRATPGQIYRAIYKMSNCIPWRFAGNQFDIDALVRIEAKRMRRVIRRIEDGPEILHEFDLHIDLQKSVYSKARPEDLIGSAHLTISLAVNCAR